MIEKLKRLIEAFVYAAYEADMATVFECLVSMRKGNDVQ